MSVTEWSACHAGRRRQAWRRIASLSSALLLVGACGGKEDGTPAAPPPEPTADVEVTATFPGEFQQQTVAAVHLWVLRVPEGTAVTCGQLIGGDIDPYDLTAVVIGDVAQTETDQVLAAKNVLLGDALVYVEAVDYGGDVVLAGCESIEVEEPSSSAAIELQKARVFDCGAPETEDGSRCDDGDICTVGERCQNGDCRGGEARDCTHLSTDCMAAVCDPEEGGCVVTPGPNDTPCDDGLFCTEAESCVDGECVGTPLDCSSAVGACQIAQCDEEFDECVTDYLPYGASCEDDYFCTTDDYCDGYGSCYGGGTTDCSALDEAPCREGVCDTFLDECVAESTFAYCDDGNTCTYSDSCNSSGVCTGYSNTGASCTGPGPADLCAPYACNSAGECVSTPTYPGASCDDGDPCTTDSCDGLGACVSTPRDCSAWGYDQCNPGICNPSTGSCTSQALTGAVCDYLGVGDGVCTAGSCGPAT